MEPKKAANPAFKRQAIIIVIFGVIAAGVLHLYLAWQTRSVSAEQSIEATEQPDAQTAYDSLIDHEEQPPVGIDASSSGQDPLLDPIGQPIQEPSLLPTEDTVIPAQNKDPAAARLLLHPECHRYRHVLNETYRDPSPWALARRKVGMDILTEIGCFESTTPRPVLHLQHPDHRLLLSGRATAEQYRSIVDHRSGTSCQTWVDVLAQMAASPTATDEDIAEYYSRSKTARCPTATVTGYRGFGAARWDTTAAPVSGYPEEAIAAIRLVRANPRCVDFVHDLSESAETSEPAQLQFALSETLKSAHQAGCLYP